MFIITDAVIICVSEYIWMRLKCLIFTNFSQFLAEIIQLQMSNSQFMESLLQFKYSWKKFKYFLLKTVEENNAIAQTLDVKVADKFQQLYWLSFHCYCFKYLDPDKFDSQNLLFRVYISVLRQKRSVEHGVGVKGYIAIRLDVAAFTWLHMYRAPIVKLLTNSGISATSSMQGCKCLRRYAY